MITLRDDIGFWLAEWRRPVFDIDVIVPEPPRFNYFKYLIEMMTYQMCIPYALLSEENYDEWIHWLIQTGQLDGL